MGHFVSISLDKCDGFVVLRCYPVFLRDMPSSFQGKCGQILYSLEAKLTRSIRFDTKAKTDFPFVSKADQSMIPYLMKPQHGTKDKDVMFFASGKISVSIHTERQGYQQGEALKVRAIIVNNSTRPVTPKNYLYEKQCFYAQKKRKVHTHNILKEKGDRVPAGTRQTVTQVLTIPPQLPSTIFNCPILKLEYRLKVVLDVKLAIDPEIKLPIVVLTATQTLGQEPPPYSSFGFESQVPTVSELPPPTKCLLPHQISIENCRGMEILNWAQKSVLYSTPPSSSLPCPRGR
ncbi:arrestin domain-containing protein 3-like isoform X2 [Oncorhynchus nerka]|uniref:arrestin domain-containing protein 3-like isoform X2 n=1 Tax=Oncorhynchus nerka TaxID=8023 RepID=UPI0031B7EC63